jgi:hypothetical protein
MRMRVLLLLVGAGPVFAEPVTLVSRTGPDVALEAPVKRVFCLSEPCGPLMVAIADCAGGADWQQYTPEGLLALDPDVIVVEDWGAKPGTAAPQTWAEAGVPLWSEIRAVAEGGVQDVPVIGTAPYSPLAWGQTMDALVPILYPDRVPESLPLDASR